MATLYSFAEHHKQTRPKSSVLANLSFMHKRTQSDGAALPSPPDQFVASPTYDVMPVLPNDHTHARALGELQYNQLNQPPPSPKKSREGRGHNGDEDGFRSLHKKTMSVISLKSLAGKDSEKSSKPKEPKAQKPKKTKSSTNLASLLSRPKSAKNLRKQAAEEEAQSQRDKENENPNPPPSEPSRPPIYAQFSSEHFAKQPLGGKFLEDEIDLYTPRDYTDGQQRNFHGIGQPPTLGQREDQRPKPTYLPHSFSLQDISRKVSDGSRHSAELLRRVSGAKRPSFERKKTETSIKSETSDKPEKAAPSKGQRVLRAVSNFTAKATKAAGEGAPHAIEDKDVDREFEAMLDRRNIPEHQRGKMRSLAMSMKKDFVKQDWAEIAAAKSNRPGTNSSDSSAEATGGAHDVPEVKKKRPRSRTFTLSRSSSKETLQTVKQSKPEGILGKHSRTRSTDSTNTLGGSKSLAASGTAVAQAIIAKAKGQLPDDFVSYLRKVPKPELVEVGRLHKLRLLLRNETVAWTDDFIGQGGMDEIVGLLHRTIQVEWREEHEDALLHEVLLCLKALATTELALEKLNSIQTTLFPALLHMLFDEEKKGPSEFTTRNIVSSLLFTYLKSAPLSERTHRAMTLLSYLRDPEPNESQRPVGFVLDMRRPRPYRVWCKEVVNVTKEVFWIFLHNLNVIPLPGASPNEGYTGNEITTIDPQYEYMTKHFPQERPPVPAAPYVGGVEWDATNYLASHLDLVNGIIACLPTQSERNILREQLLVSGWEKCMGGTLRLCKEKFYGAVHDGLRTWVAAGVQDVWDVRDVRSGPCQEGKRSPMKNSPQKKKLEDAPKIEMKLDFLGGGEKKVSHHDAWL